MTTRISHSANVLTVAALCFVAAIAAPAAAQMRILVADPEAGTKKRGALFAVDELGNRTTISDFGFALKGPLGVDPTDVVVQPGGLILVLDKGAGTKGRGALFAVDEETGKRRIISDFGNGLLGPVGTSLGADSPARVTASGVQGLVVAADGRALVGDASGGVPCVFPELCGVIYAVEPDGTRSIFRDYRAPMGPGPAFLTTLAADPDGSILVGFSEYVGPGHENSGGFVERVASDGLTATEVAFLDPPGDGDVPLRLAVEASGQILATSLFAAARLLRIDPQSMTYQSLTTFDLSPSLTDRHGPVGVAVAPDGAVFLTTREAGPPYEGVVAPWLVRVDPVTGAFVVLSDFSDVAQGTKGVLPSGIAILLSGNPKAGDLLVVDYQAGTSGRGALFTVDASTGDRTLFSDFGDPAQGPIGSDPYGVAIDRGGRIWVIDQRAGSACSFGFGCGALFVVDPLTGMRQMRSDFGNAAQGPSAGLLYGIAVAPNGDVLVADQVGPLFRIDAKTGARQVVASFGGRPSDVAVTPAGDLLVPDPDYNGEVTLSLHRIPAGGGAPTVLSDFLDSAQGLPLGEVPIAVHADTSGRILVIDQAVELAGDGGFGVLYEVDPSDGSRTVVTDFTDETQGPLGFNPSDVVVDAAGNILVTDFDSGADLGSGAIFLVDAATGNRTFLSDFSDAAQGPTGFEPSGLAIFPGGAGFPGVDVRDLAVTKIVVPAVVKLTAAKPSLVKDVKVQIQNRGTQPLQVAAAATLEALVALEVTSFGACPAPAPSPVVPSKLPLTIKSKQRLTLSYELTLDCANDPAKSTKKDAGHDDFEVRARVNHAALGASDEHSEDDACPRSVTPPHAVEPFPDGKIKDKGCGEKKPDGTFGAPVLIDVVID